MAVIIKNDRRRLYDMSANCTNVWRVMHGNADYFNTAKWAIEEQLTQMLIAQNRWEKAFVHCFSAMNCWVQAGDLHRALGLGQQLLAAEELPAQQRSRVQAYVDTLQERMAQWMSQWVPHQLTAGD